MSLQLPHGCYVGKISVNPSNWEEPEASMDQDWYIHYRFFDPNFAQRYPKGLSVQVRGMNDAKAAALRRRITKGLIQNEKDRLGRGYNPILKKTVPLNNHEIPPDTPFAVALEAASKNLPKSPTQKEVTKALRHIAVAIRQLRYDQVKISEVRRRHVKAILDKVAANRQQEAGKEWGACSYNHYRSYFGMLFNYLEEVEAIEEVDPVSKIKKKRTTKKIRITPSDEDILLIDEKIHAHYYTFWRFIIIFSQSGARTSEMMQVRRHDVQLEEQRFKVTIRKGSGEIEEAWKTITAEVLPLWREVMAEGRPEEKGQPGKKKANVYPPDPDDYLFSRDLRPGLQPIGERQVTVRWRDHIKRKLGIKADFYSLKKKYSTEVVSKALAQIEAAQQVAAQHNSHKGTAMMKKHYDGEHQQRLHRKLRAV